MIYLIQSRTKWFDVSKEENRHVNLNLAYLRAANILRSEGYEFQIIDFNNCDSIAESDFVKKLDGGIYFISVDMMSVAHAYELTKKIKESHDSNVVVWSSMGIGFLLPFSLIYRDVVMKEELVDFVYNGDEGDLVHFVRAIVQRKDVGDIHGVGYRRDGGDVVFTQLARGGAQYVAEDYGSVDMEDYIWRWGKDILVGKYIKRQRIIPVSTGVGCAYSCSFCINSNPDWKTRFKLKPEAMLLSQLHELIERYSPDVIWFQDDNFFVNKSRATKALQFLNERGVKWCGQARADYFRDSYINANYFREYIAPGALWFGVGFETFSDRLRQSCGKNVTRSQLDRVCDLCAEHDVSFNPAFIYGLPQQTRCEFKEDVRTLIAYRRKYPNLTFTYQCWRPYPGTLEYERLMEKSEIMPCPQDLSSFVEMRAGGVRNSSVNADIQDLVPLNELLIKTVCGEGGPATRTILSMIYPLMKHGFDRDVRVINYLAGILLRANVIKRRMVDSARRWL
jgi:radical SAM superfamily enzyme YgiQ (UPF0313 family)